MILDTVDRFQKPIRRFDRVALLSIRDGNQRLIMGTVLRDDDRIAGDLIIDVTVGDHRCDIVTRTGGEVVVMDPDDPRVTRFILENS